ncbi:hypothetical protein ACO0R3_004107 [Hanseniaspora guilliermondii]
MKIPSSNINKRYLLLTNTLSSKTAAATNTIAKNNYFLKATDVVMNNNKFIDPNKNNKLSDDDKKLSTLNYHNNKSFLSKWYFLASISVFACLLMYSVLKDDDDQDERVPLLLLDEDGNVIYTRKQKIKIAANDWMFFFYSTLPLNAVSRVWGQLNSLDLPVWLRPYSFKLYSYCFGVKLDEMEQPDLTHYKNLSEFFYRTIKDECRPINFNDDIVMPSDGKVLSLGEIDPITGEIEQVKGINYNVKEFLGTHSHQLMNKSIVEYTPTLNDISKIEVPPQDIDLEQGLNINTDKHSQIIQDHQDSEHLKVLKDLMDTGKSDMASSREDLKHNKKFMFIVIYLAPGDYHHYHSPTNWLVKIRRHFPGQLYSVSPYFQKNFKNLFILNERVSLLGNWKHGFFSMTPVGATNVGSIKLNFDKDLVTNDKKRLYPTDKAQSLDINCYEATYWSQAPNNKKEGIPLVMGEEMGGFMLGSTVVLCFEVPKEFEFDCKQGDSVKMGERLGHLESKDI